MVKQEILRAGKRLGTFMIHQAARRAHNIGFGYEESLEAPSTFEELCDEYRECLNTRRPFRVWEGASDGTVYGSREANWAFRFLHDLIHVEHGLGFDYKSELQVAEIGGRAVAERFGLGSLEFAVYLVDTAGQVEYQHQTGQFVKDQVGFAVAVLITQKLRWARGA